MQAAPDRTWADDNNILTAPCSKRPAWYADATLRTPLTNGANPQPQSLFAIFVTVSIDDFASGGAEEWNSTCLI